MLYTAYSFTKYKNQIPASWDSFLLEASLPKPDREKLAEHLRSLTRWDEAIQSLQQEGILPFFYQNLKNLNLIHLLPESAKGSIKERLRRQAMHQLHQDSIFTEIAGLFNQHQIPFIPIKGLTLRHNVYNNPALRPMLDLDLLVRPQDTGRITTLMRELGVKQLTGLHSEYLDSLQHHLPTTTYKNIPIEFHTRFFNKMSSYSLLADIAWQNSVETKLLNQSLQVLPADINLIYITIHAYKHLMRLHFKLNWLTDVCLCLQKFTINWEEVTGLLQNEADKKAFFGMMGLVETLDQFSFPEKIHSQFKEEWTLETHKALDKYLQGDQLNLKINVIKTLAKLDTQNKIQYMASILFPSAKFLKKKYKTNNPILIGFLYPYHTIAKVTEGVWYLAGRIKSLRRK